MPRRYSTREVAEALERIEIRLLRQRGSHVRYRGAWRGQERNVTLVAGQKTIPARTLSSILKQAGLTADELSRLIRRETVT
ncbi:MAG: type II toxin-antitoxin system HicA family toxin [Chloroflexi bacterium]|nr:type II toxin-antitoxin system HicA family toxin [Chloroflexota bacterium]